MSPNAYITNSRIAGLLAVDTTKAWHDATRGSTNDGYHLLLNLLFASQGISKGLLIQRPNLVSIHRNNTICDFSLSLAKILEALLATLQVLL
jgi:hypothetical protein